MICLSGLFLILDALYTSVLKTSDLQLPWITEHTTSLLIFVTFGHQAYKLPVRKTYIYICISSSWLAKTNLVHKS